jgi:hypothetical protein
MNLGSQEEIQELLSAMRSLAEDVPINARKEDSSDSSSDDESFSDSESENEDEEFAIPLPPLGLKRSASRFILCVCLVL